MCAACHTVTRLSKQITGLSNEYLVCPTVSRCVSPASGRSFRFKSICVLKMLMQTLEAMPMRYSLPCTQPAHQHEQHMAMPPIKPQHGVVYDLIVAYLNVRHKF